MEQSRDELFALWAHVLEQVQFGIVISDPSTRQITRVNRAYAHLLGYEPDQMIGMPGERLIARDSLARMSEASSVLDSRGYHTYQLDLVRRDGSTVPVLASSSTVEIASGAVRVSSVIDISERVQLEQSHALAAAALQASAARLELLARTSHELAATSGDVEQLLALVARRLAELLGDGCIVRLSSADGKWLEPAKASVYHRVPSVRLAAREAFGTVRQRIGEGIAGRVAASGQTVLLADVQLDELLAQAPEGLRPFLGQTKPSSILMLPLRSRDKTLGVVSLIRTPPSPPYTAEDQRFAQELADRAGLAVDNAALVATLEQRVAERTAKLESANRELEAFGYSVSHDLRAPLRTIVGFSQSLREDYAALLPPEAVRDLARIQSAAGRMSNLVDDLLKLSRITRGTLNIGSFDLTAVAHAIVADLHRRDPERTTPIHVADGMMARGDSRLAAIILENLLGNAWKFTAKHPGAEISVGHNERVFFVRDTGVGFDPAYAARLFEPFQRLHARDAYEGTGIGLATVARIIRRHGGKVWAEGAVNQGATFYFTLSPDV